MREVVENINLLLKLASCALHVHFNIQIERKQYKIFKVIHECELED